MKTTYRIPKRFYADHLARDCGDPDNIVGETKTHYTVALTPETYKDLLSDCDYYVFMADELDRELFGLVASARATLKILQASGVPT